MIRVDSMDITSVPCI